MLINLFGLLLNWFGSYQRQLNVWTWYRYTTCLEGVHTNCYNLVTFEFKSHSADWFRTLTIGFSLLLTASNFAELMYCGALHWFYLTCSYAPWDSSRLSAKKQISDGLDNSLLSTCRMSVNIPPPVSFVTVTLTQPSITSSIFAPVTSRHSHRSLSASINQHYQHNITISVQWSLKSWKTWIKPAAEFMFSLLN